MALFDAPGSRGGSQVYRMGRHSRRGYVGQTNLNKHVQQAMPTRTSEHHSPALVPSPERAIAHKRKLRAKWRLDIAPVPRAIEPLRYDTDCNASAEGTLASTIEAVQHDRKSFKDESWYHSPIGRGSKSSVLLAALMQQDYTDTGYLSRSAIAMTLQHSNFGLSDSQVHQLLQRYDPAQEMIHYKTFVGQIHFTDPTCSPHPSNDLIFRLQSYLEKIRDRASSLIAQSQEGPLEGGAGSPLRLSPLAVQHRSPVHLVTNTEPSVIVGNSPIYSPSSRLATLAERTSPSRLPVPDDSLSFENDKYRKAQRAQAKAAVLLAHISRIDEYSRHQDAVSTQHDNLRIAAKAIHQGEHLEKIYDEQHRQMHRLENQGKGLAKSPQTRAQRSVSKDSMFYDG